MMSSGPKWSYIALLGSKGKIYQLEDLLYPEGQNRRRSVERNFSNLDWQEVLFLTQYCLVKERDL